MRPNIFSFATSELSQDAAICWLVSWADPKYEKSKPEICRLARAFIDHIFRQAGHEPVEHFESVDARRQEGGIDILCVINKDIVLIIEDKVGTQEHSNQLARYLEYASTSLGFVPKAVVAAYVQTGDQSDYQGVIRAGYVPVRRPDLLTLFDSEHCKTAISQSDILEDLVAHLRGIETRVESYSTLPLASWSWDSWKGLYSALQRQFRDGRWSYVPNAAGGFLGFWCHFRENQDCSVYLQLEQERFCFKISVDEEDRRKRLRDIWHKKIVGMSGNSNIKVGRPDRFGHGQVMTVAILDEEYRKVRPDGLLDLSMTIEVIHSAQKIIDDCINDEITAKGG